IELGYVIDPVFQNKGFASEALNGMIHKMFDLGFKEVVCGAFDDNDASIRVMEKCGMVKMNRFDEIEYQGKFHHCVYYSKVNE
ncbi:MAG: GNAT family N-acetyltransferase, partial [Traorella sp.]